VAHEDRRRLPGNLPLDRGHSCGEPGVSRAAGQLVGRQPPGLAMAEGVKREDPVRAAPTRNRV
jgi:hypothetical protein